MIIKIKWMANPNVGIMLTKKQVFMKSVKIKPVFIIYHTIIRFVIATPNETQ